MNGRKRFSSLVFLLFGTPDGLYGLILESIGLYRVLFLAFLSYLLFF